MVTFYDSQQQARADVAEPNFCTDSGNPRLGWKVDAALGHLLNNPSVRFAASSP